MFRQRGAALLAAMLTVTLVATLAAAATWQQWRSIEIETSERARIQAAWILVGALDWSRLILQEDLRSSSNDHLAEPWAIPLEEARLSTFLAAQQGAATTDASTDTQNAFLSGQIVDLQARLNIASLVVSGVVQPAVHAQFARLFAQVGVPLAQLAQLERALQQAQAPDGDGSGAGALMPQHTEQLVWLGLAPRSIQLLAPHTTVLPKRTPVNINTASTDVLLAAIEGLDRAGAEALTSARQTRPFLSLEDVRQVLGKPVPLQKSEHDVKTDYFEVRGRLRLGDMAVEERSLVHRDNQVSTVWRQRVAAQVRPGAP